ncbi:MAG: 4-hydroxy-3-methylbut-2-enyl diphosphate reductase [Clostridia bacterium]|nr:4-hydroxy-3-methylbut-2-enyl diphosphate reductase [Clostridia bacterium]
MKENRFLYRLTQFFFFLPVKLLTLPVVKGRRNLPQKGGAILCLNHVSLMDIPVIFVSLCRPVRFMAKSELTGNSFGGKFLKALGAVGVNRGKNDVGAIQKMVSLCKQGALTAIFPQGTRCPGKNPADTRFLNGVGLIALKSGVPVIPVCLKMKKQKFCPFRPYRVFIGKPLFSDELTAPAEEKDKYRYATEKIAGEIFRLGGFVSEHCEPNDCSAKKGQTAAGMEAILAENAGVCFAVKRATDFVEDLLQKHGNDAVILTLGHLIHNRLFNEDLAKKGVEAVTVEEAEQIAADCVEKQKSCFIVIRTHGVPLWEEERLRRLEQASPYVHVEDLTCPFVKRIHRIADTQTDENTRFLLLGDSGHPEVQGIMSHAKGEKAVFSSSEDLISFFLLRQNDEKKTVFASQTTHNLQEWKKTEKNIKNHYTNAFFFDTICNVTEARQTEAVSLSQKADAILVIGGKESSNTAKLYSLCKERCPDTLWIERVSDIPSSFPHPGTKSVGITAGASTPRGIILEVYHYVRKL